MNFKYKYHKYKKKYLDLKAKKLPQRMQTMESSINNDDKTVKDDTKMTSNLNDLFQLVIMSSEQLHKDNINADGLVFWKPIKKLLLEYDNVVASSWKHINDNIVKWIMLLPEYVIDSEGKKYIIETNHFLIQTVRLTIKEKPSLRKVIQVALNIGQYIGLGHKRREWMYLDKYLTEEDIKKLSEHVTDDLISQVYNVILKKVPSIKQQETLLLKKPQ